MQIHFQKPETNPKVVIAGARNGQLLSRTYSLTSEEKELLKQNSERMHKEHKQSTFFHPAFYKQSDDHSLTLLQIADFEDEKSLSPAKAEELGAQIFVHANALKEKDIVIDFSEDFSAELAAHVAAGFQIRSFNFNRYKTEPETPFEIENVYFQSADPETSARCFARLSIVAEAVATVRTLSSEAPNVLYPETFAQQAKTLKKWGVKVEILDEKDMDKLGMNALLGVAQGSVRPPFLVTMQWDGGVNDDAPIALVGKGVTFDSGGISLKPSNNMHEMKEDMTGAGIVLATIQMAAQLKLPINLVGVAGLVENMPSGTAQRPADIVRAMSGLTIEVQNTDAEGRLVLADAIHYTQEYFKPKCLVDFATLTGAIQVALGHEFAGLFSNNDNLSESLRESGEEVLERLWRLPLDPAFDKDIESDIADIRNVGAGRGAGSITAAQFLQRFVHDIPWAHIDIAAVTYDKKNRPLTGSGFTGFGVRLMYAFLTNIIKKSSAF